ncbi:diguanylate cyclase [Sphingomonas sp. NBWT7]|uniref:diguanylate cyclase n=1 Tax=Sphingomonas sp. NBWT7 TaxID=2596913 RepID=UPI001624D4D3|nr:diguanylate cyclase [Sphingomonas sp. NBWT7]QNE33011.1 diguanylate cyclase [Sphingomonas sp. NBWT7]
MRLATITNWAYGATVVLTLLSGTTMILASNAQDRERAAVEQRYLLDRGTSKLDEEVFALSDQARQYLNSGDPSYRVLYQHDAAALASVERRIAQLGDAGAGPAELHTLKEAIRWADTLLDEQKAALAAYDHGDVAQARTILFGGEYERELERIRAQIERFQQQLDQRTEAQVASAAQVARTWKTTSEIALAITGLLFLCVLYFIFKQRVLKPVVRLSDVVNRLAAQDYAAEPPNLTQIDEIGDMAQAIRVFRENGLERQRLQQERDADRMLRDLLSRMTQRMQGCNSLHDLEEIARRFIPEIVPELAGRLYLIDPARNAVMETCNWLYPKQSRPEFAPTSCWALRRGLPHRPAGPTIDVPCDHLSHDGAMLDTLCLPLNAHGETFGLLYFERRQDAGDTRSTAETYLTMLAENIGLAVSNLRLRERLRDMAMGDALTGLANRRQLDSSVGQILSVADQMGGIVSCLMIDVDHFKRFNDTFGHDAGDAVLQEVGAVLRGAVRDKELAFRYGGEEFLVLLPRVDLAQAMERAELIRTRIFALRLVHEGQQLGAVQASVGVATAPLHCAPGRLVQTADAALLRAKAQGRDRVVVAAQRNTPVVAAG